MTAPLSACRSALWRGLLTSAPQAVLDEKGYVSEVRQNLVEGVGLADFEADFRQGDGNELQVKFRAAHSSAALAPLAERGDPLAERLVGDMYRTGRGVAQDFRKMADWYRKAATQGQVDVQAYLSMMYINGSLGVPRDYVLAYMWADLAAASRPADALLRDAVAGEMTQDQIAEAQRLARKLVAH